MKNFIFMFFTLALGSLNSQVLFHFSISRQYKLSFNDVLLNESSINENTTFPDFSIYHSKKTFDQPKRIALNLGMTIKRHQLHVGLQTDGISSKYAVFFNYYDPILDTYRPNLISGKGKSPQSRVSLNYDYYILKKEKKTNLFISASIGLCYRAGPKGIGSVGTLGSSGNISPTKTIQITSASFTDEPKYVYNFGGSIGTDIFFKKYYFLSLNVGFTFSNRSLYFTENTVKVIDNSNINEFKFKAIDKCSSVYFGISRRFQIFPWKSIKNNPIWDEFHPLNPN